MTSKTIQIQIPEYSDSRSASAAIQKLLAQSSEIEIEAEKIADEYQVSFSVGDYGSGRTYYPKGSAADVWGSEGWEQDENGNLVEGQWLSSSEMC